MGGSGTAEEGDVDDFTRRFEQMQALIDAQAATVARLQERLDRMEAMSGPQTNSGTPLTASPVLPKIGEPTSRRNLMTKGAAAAAGAAIAGTVLNVASASPAADASGTFDGDPAVLAVGTDAGIGIRAETGSNAGVHGVANTGVGVRGESLSGLGMTGFSSTGVGVGGASNGPDGAAITGQNAALTGVALAVVGVSESTSATAVKARATAKTGSTVALHAIADSSGGTGVRAHATATDGSTIAIEGITESPSGIGVYGLADAGTGSTIGVWGTTASPVGTGVLGSGGTGVRASSGRTQLQLAGNPASPLGAGQPRVAGEVVLDVNRDLWLCVADGTPGTWTRLAGPSTAGSLSVLSSTTRIYDSRPGSQPPTGTKTKFQDGDVRPLAANGNGSGVPTTAKAVMISATATNTNPGGFFAFFKNGIAWPQNSSLSWGSPGSTIANLAVVAVDGAAKFRARCQGAGGADLVVDCIGYFQ